MPHGLESVSSGLSMILCLGGGLGPEVLEVGFVDTIPDEML